MSITAGFPGTFGWRIGRSRRVAEGSCPGIDQRYADSHYQSIYFHESGEKARRAYECYVGALVGAIDIFRKERGVFPIVVAMERLDAGPCQRISELLGGVPVLTSEQYNAFQLVSILRSCHLIVSSRYHAIVTSMPGLIPSAGVTIVERVRNLMRERGHSELALEADDPQLEAKLLGVLHQMTKDRESITDSVGRTVVNNLKAMAKMGEYFQQYVRQNYPDFPIHNGRSWEDYLPPLAPNLAVS